LPDEQFKGEKVEKIIGSFLEIAKNHTDDEKSKQLQFLPWIAHNGLKPELYTEPNNTEQKTINMFRKAVAGKKLNRVLNAIETEVNNLPCELQMPARKELYITSSSYKNVNYSYKGKIYGFQPGSDNGKFQDVKNEADTELRNIR
jgi:hypothetical protein